MTSCIQTSDLALHQNQNVNRSASASALFQAGRWQKDFQVSSGKPTETLTLNWTSTCTHLARAEPRTKAEFSCTLTSELLRPSRIKGRPPMEHRVWALSTCNMDGKPLRISELIIMMDHPRVVRCFKMALPAPCGSASEGLIIVTSPKRELLFAWVSVSRRTSMCDAHQPLASQTCL